MVGKRTIRIGNEAVSYHFPLPSWVIALEDTGVILPGEYLLDPTAEPAIRHGKPPTPPGKIEDAPGQGHLF